MALPNQVKPKATVTGNYRNRLMYLAGYLEGLSEDMATAVDEKELDIHVLTLVGDAHAAIDRAVSLIETA